MLTASLFSSACLCFSASCSAVNVGTFSGSRRCQTEVEKYMYIPVFTGITLKKSLQNFSGQLFVTCQYIKTTLLSRTQSHRPVL